MKAYSYQVKKISNKLVMIYTSYRGRHPAIYIFLCGGMEIRDPDGHITSSNILWD